VNDNTGLTLATTTLQSTQDVVALCRRARSAAGEFRLDAAGICRLCAAVVEIGREVTAGGPPPTAQLTLADGPSMQVSIHVTDLARLGGLESIEYSIERVSGLVHHAAVVPSGPDDAHITLAVLFRSALPGKGVTGGSAEPGSRAVKRSTDDPAQVSDDPLDRAHHELIDANREMIALHAELAEQADRLRLSEEKLHRLLDSVPDYAICMLSPHGVVTSWNAGGERLFGYSADEVIGRSVSAFYLASDAEEGAPAAQLMAAESEGRLEAEGLRLRRGGQAFEAHTVLTPIRDESRELRGFSLVVRDISERKRLEDDLRRRAEELAVAHRAKEDFLATLSHELRTPLNAMLGWTRLLRIGKLDAAGTARALETIERNAHLQEQLIADILDVSRIVTGKLRLELRPTALGPLVENTIDTLRPSADAKSITLTAALHADGTVLGDPDRLEQVVWNLIVNAIKFTPIGGSIGVTLERHGGSAILTVTDTGEGISSDVLPYVFDRFRQGDASVTRPHGGLGLGLSMVRHIVELHGGKSTVMSEGRGRGATFTVQLPIRDVRDALAPAEHVLAGVRVLVVDDEPDAREVVVKALDNCGARTLSAGSTGEAMKLLAEFRPDVLVSDLRMPGEDGYALIRRVRSEGGVSQALPAIALTGMVHPEDRRRALTAGYQSFVPKPVEVTELADVIRRIARKH